MTSHSWGSTYEIMNNLAFQRLVSWNWSGRSWSWAASQWLELYRKRALPNHTWNLCHFMNKIFILKMIKQFCSASLPNYPSATWPCTIPGNSIIVQDEFECPNFNEVPHFGGKGYVFTLRIQYLFSSTWLYSNRTELPPDFYNFGENQKRDLSRFWDWNSHHSRRTLTKEKDRLYFSIQ